MIEGVDDEPTNPDYDYHQVNSPVRPAAAARSVSGFQTSLNQNEGEFHP